MPRVFGLLLDSDADYACGAASKSSKSSKTRGILGEKVTSMAGPKIKKYLLGPIFRIKKLKYFFIPISLNS